MCASVRITTEFRLLVRGRAGGMVGRRGNLAKNRNQNRRIKWGWVEGQMKEGLCEGTPTTESLLRSHMETYNCRNFLKYMHI